ncbi:MAG: succinate dehydrogenase cytochrome b subunit [Chitinophagaceae bacterium]|jgi:succinate dehydrogenase / fumarate reductase cytochrome b subunit|nr:succinate dehydrogenase cytochrome b subunit [Chitinophagaceae bacterium]
MTWKQVFVSSVGRKLVMGFTGIFLILFLIVHAGLNACIWAGDGGEMFLRAAHFMGSNWVPRILEIGLFVGFILHIVQGFMLTAYNRSKRSIGYAVNYADGSKWYSRSMGLLGTLVLLFLIMHLSHFWFPNRASQGFLLGEEINLFEKMKTEFSVLWVVIAYVIGCISLAYHLAHGFQSAFKTLGVHNKRYNQMLTSIGYGFSIIVPLVFAMMPISFYLGWV